MSSSVSTKVVLNTETFKKLKDVPDKCLYAIAKQTLDKTYPIIPMRKAALRNATMSYGVRKNSDGYFLESKTDYAVKVYNYDDGKINWYTKGTHSKWFERTWNEKGDQIIETSVSKYKI